MQNMQAEIIEIMAMSEFYIARNTQMSGTEII